MVFVEIIRGGGLRNDIVGAISRPPGGNMVCFNVELAKVLGRLRGRTPI